MKCKKCGANIIKKNNLWISIDHLVFPQYCVNYNINEKLSNEDQKHQPETEQENLK
jgi:hypothetical protein